MVACVLVATATGVAIAVFTGRYVAFPVYVTSNSMAPYAVAGDYGIAVYTHDIRRGDVIVFRFPFGTPTLAIKRAAILPGECMPPPGAGPDAAPLNPAVPAGVACATVPEGAVFIVGDNIHASIDSRSFGAVPATEIVGKVVLMVPVARWLARWHEMTGSG